MMTRTALTSLLATALCCTLTTTLAATAAAAPAIAADALPTFKLQGKLTVSGLSSGGYMANQFHLAHSDIVSGAAIIAAGPYGCAQNSLATALTHCFNKDSSAPDLAAASQLLGQYAQQQLIAPLANVKGSPVFLLHGTLDTTVHAKVSAALATQYRALGADVTEVNDQPFAHHFPTAQTGTACNESAPPFLGACQYDAAGIFLKKLYPALKAKSASATGHLLSVNQQQLGGEAASGLGETGYLFMPDSCAKGASCQLHISFHGCKQYQGVVGDAYAKGTGINDWAAANQLVVLYPQTKASALAPMNPNGCWDWWGYTDANYANRQGVQLQAVLQMAKALGYQP